MSHIPALQLRPIDPGDLPAFFEHGQDEDACWMAAFVADDPSDRAAFDAHWEKVLAHPEYVRRTIDVDGAVAGHIIRFDRDGDPEITYWIGREFWGKGVATAALRLFLLEDTARPLHARVAADNPASIRVLEKCGFVRIATERGYANARGCEIEEYVMVLR